MSFEGKINCQYFEVSSVDVEGKQLIKLTNDSFYTINCIKCSGNFAMGETMSINYGETVFIPATEAILNVEGNISIVISKM